MVHYKCNRCKTILKAPEDLRGCEHTCPHCMTVNVVPGGATHPHHHRKETTHGTHAAHEESEEVKEPLTFGKVLKTCLWGLLAVASTCALGLAIYYRPQDPSVALIAPFEPVQAEYYNIEAKDVSAEKTPGPYIVGKAVLANFMDSQTAMGLGENIKDPHPHLEELGDGSWRGMNWREFAHLPEAIRATKPEEVQTVVWLKWWLQNVAQDKKEPRYQVCCDVNIIDKAKGLLVGKSTFRGGRPPLAAEKGITVTCGGRPSKEIVAYLSELPRYKTDEAGHLVELPKPK